MLSLMSRMVPLVRAPGGAVAFRPVQIGQSAPPTKPPISSKVYPHIVGAGISLFGVALGVFGYHYRKDPLGQILLGAGGSIVGAGIVLIGLNLAHLENDSAGVV